ncbi:MAG: peptidoglycan DD-metalloendopeptidase family protein [Candidatus Blackburnbacteria bacterium]|nr:peptidoglycan DD-metalloendopeptidase family protein [Candidatus Blackburnbacteria bacterium]
MADDLPQDQTQATTEPTQPPSVTPTDQTSMKTPQTQPTPEQQAVPVSSEPSNIPNPPNFSNPEPVAPVTTESESQPAETKTETPPSQQPEQTPVTSVETPPPSVSPPVINIPSLHYPFSGNFPVTFSFGQQSDNEEITKKFQEWGIAGHNGLDFGLPAGNEVFACDVGKVFQSGDNGDFGISIIIQHSWGQSIYAHLQETKVKEGEDIGVNKVIGLSGSSGAAFGEHLHFGIKPNNPDLNNGYLGFIDPAPYLSLSSQKEETPPVQTPPTEEQKPSEETKPEGSQQPPVKEVPPPIKLEPEKPAEQTEIPQQSESPQTPQVSEEEIQKRVDEKLKAELDTRRQNANEARQTKREENLMKIEKLIEEKKQINNDNVRELLHVSQSTATEYLQTLIKRGTIKSEGKGKATGYHF